VIPEAQQESAMISMAAGLVPVGTSLAYGEDVWMAAPGWRGREIMLHATDQATYLAGLDALITEAETNEIAFAARCERVRSLLLGTIEDLQQEARDLRAQARSLDERAAKIRTAVQDEDWLAIPRGVLPTEDLEVFSYVSPSGLLDSEE